MASGFMQRLSLLMATFAMIMSSVLCSSTSDDAKTPVFFPMYFPYGNYPRIMAKASYGTPKQPAVPAVVDLGSANYWVFDKGAVVNYGSESLGGVGPCNETASPAYNYRNSSTASKIQKFDSLYSYGGNGKFVFIYNTTNDTINFGFSSPALQNRRVALSNFTTIRQQVDNCSVKLTYDHSILGLSRFNNPTFKTPGPSFRQDLLDQGMIKSSSMSWWFDRGPEAGNGTFHGTALFGAVPHGKYSGKLVRLPLVPPKEAYVGYYIPAPKLAITKDGKTTQLTTGKAKQCLLDSGTGDENLAISQVQFEQVAGLIKHGFGFPTYNGSCDSIPRNLTLDYTFPGSTKGESVTIKVPLRNYARGSYNGGGSKPNPHLCSLSMELSKDFPCVLGASFTSAMFMVVKDNGANSEIALAQGGVSLGAREGVHGLGNVTEISQTGGIPGAV